jgi:hypothetical protein
VRGIGNIEVPPFSAHSKLPQNDIVLFAATKWFALDIIAIA